MKCRPRQPGSLENAAGGQLAAWRGFVVCGLQRVRDSRGDSGGGGVRGLGHMRNVDPASPDLPVFQEKPEVSIVK